MKKLLVLALLLPLGACASTRAQVQPEDHPALEVPPVPPRHIEPLPAEPPPLELVADLPMTSTTPSRPRSTPARDPGAKPPADPKTEPKPETPPDPTTPAAPPVPPLRPQGTGDGPELQRQIRDSIDRANKILNNVDYQSLNDERRANYDYARSFIKQAEEALHAKNLTSAKSLAERAETIAKLLAGG
jgi:hypothetical protein